MPPISTNMADKGYVTDDLVAHTILHEQKGGVGLIVTEVVTVEPTYVYLQEICQFMMIVLFQDGKNWWMAYTNMEQKF